MTEPTLPPEPAKDATADELEADIAATREQLGETIDALEDKLNVSAQAKRKVDQTKTQLADKVTATTSGALHKVTTVTTQVSDTVGHSRAQVTDALGQAKAKVTRTGPGAPTRPPAGPLSAAVDRSYDNASEAGRVTWTAEGGQTTPGVTGHVKNISTRLATKVNEARNRTSATGTAGDADAKRVRLDNATSGSTEDADGVVTGVRWTSSAAAGTATTGGTTASLTTKAAQVTARIRRNPRSALTAAAAVLAGVVWLTWRRTRNPDLLLTQE